MVQNKPPNTQLQRFASAGGRRVLFSLFTSSSVSLPRLGFCGCGGGESASEELLSDNDALRNSCCGFSFGFSAIIPSSCVRGPAAAHFILLPKTLSFHIPRSPTVPLLHPRGPKRRSSPPPVDRPTTDIKSPFKFEERNSHL